MAELVNISCDILKQFAELRSELMNIAIIFAGGVGRRFKNTDMPKQFVDICGKPIIIHTLELFQNHPEIDKIYISVLPTHKKYMEALVKNFNLTKVSGIVNGGESGQESIFNALNLAYKENPSDSIVLIHDGVRPIVTSEVISENIKSTRINGNAITCTPCSETILISENKVNPTTVPYRRNTFAAQAPQSFKLCEIMDAHLKIQQRPEKYEDMIDSCTIYNYLNKKTYIVKGNTGNIKVTNPEDIFILEALIKCRDLYKKEKAEHDIAKIAIGVV